MENVICVYCETSHSEICPLEEHEVEIKEEEIIVEEVKFGEVKEDEEEEEDDDENRNRKEADRLHLLYYKRCLLQIAERRKQQQHKISEARDPTYISPTNTPLEKVAEGQKVKMDEEEVEVEDINMTNMENEMICCFCQKKIVNDDKNEEFTDYYHLSCINTWIIRSPRTPTSHLNMAQLPKALNDSLYLFGSIHIEDEFKELFQSICRRVQAPREEESSSSEVAEESEVEVEEENEVKVEEEEEVTVKEEKVEEVKVKVKEEDKDKMSEARDPTYVPPSDSSEDEEEYYERVVCSSRKRRRNRVLYSLRKRRNF